MTVTLSASFERVSRCRISLVQSAAAHLLQVEVTRRWQVPEGNSHPSMKPLHLHLLYSQYGISLLLVCSPARRPTQRLKATLRPQALNQAKMSSTSPFLAMREQLLAAYAMYIPSQRRHIVAVRICWAMCVNFAVIFAVSESVAHSPPHRLLAAHLAILSLRVWRAVRGHDKCVHSTLARGPAGFVRRFWMLRVVRRARGAYLVPHAIVGWCIPATIFCARASVLLSSTAGAHLAHSSDHLSEHSARVFRTAVSIR